MRKGKGNKVIWPGVDNLLASGVAIMVLWPTMELLVAHGATNGQGSEILVGEEELLVPIGVKKTR